ncbi:MAG: ABC transporter substrate-binding protein [Phycisphaerales bacterium]
MRVVSLVPSATEILCLIGGRDMLVGRSHECDFPGDLVGGGAGGNADAARAPVPALTGQTTPPGRDPAAIDSHVRESVAAGLPLYTLDADALAALRPDVILTQDLCRVCSIDAASVRAIAGALPIPPRIISLDPQTVEGVFDDILRVGEAVDLADRARAAVVALRGRMHRAMDHVNPFTDGPSVAFLEWTDPMFIGGHWTPQLIERAGGRSPLNPTVAAEDAGAARGPMQASRRAGPSVRVTPEALVASRPEFLVICPCGIVLADVRPLAESLARQPWFRDLPAARPPTGRIALVDGSQMFNRPGPRLIDALEWLTGWLNDRPDLIPHGFPWERL